MKNLIILIISLTSASVPLDKKQKNMDSKNNVKINFIEPNTKIVGEIESKSGLKCVVNRNAIAVVPRL